MRIGGLINFSIDGETYLAKGSFTYNINKFKKEKIAGSDQVHGHKVMPQVLFIEGALTDTSALDLQALFNAEDVTCTLELANGKVIVLERAVYAGDGNVTTEEGEIEVRFEGEDGREISG